MHYKLHQGWIVYTEDVHCELFLSDQHTNFLHKDLLIIGPLADKSLCRLNGNFIFLHLLKTHNNVVNNSFMTENFEVIFMVRSSLFSVLQYLARKSIYFSSCISIYCQQVKCWGCFYIYLNIFKNQRTKACYSNTIDFLFAYCKVRAHTIWKLVLEWAV